MNFVKNVLNLVIGRSCILQYQGFHTPLVPWLPGLGIIINWFLLAQLSWEGIWMIGLYMGISLASYFAFGYWRSVGAKNG